MDTVQKRKSRIVMLELIRGHMRNVETLYSAPGTDMTLHSMSLALNAKFMDNALAAEIERIRRLRAGTRTRKVKK